MEIARSLVRARAEAIIAYGESVFPLLIAFNKTLREKAYEVRRVEEQDKKQIEAQLLALNYIALVAPAGIPVNRFLQWFIKAIPEPIEIPETLQTWALLPTNCNTAAEGRQLLERIKGHIILDYNPGRKPLFLKPPQALPTAPFTAQPREQVEEKEKEEVITVCVLMKEDKNQPRKQRRLDEFLVPDKPKQDEATACLLYTSPSPRD